MAGTKPSKLTHGSIRKYAEAVGKHFEAYALDGKADLKKVLEGINGSVEIGGLLSSDESSEIDDDGKFSIFISRFSSSQRDRFTIAHELGHYFLHFFHSGQEKPIRFNRGGSDLAETQANVFASSFLMPENQFRSRYFESQGNLEVVANIFDVSVSAVEVRARVLGLR